jgi:predicted tellurium resistance membrane protein TerC
VVFASTVLSTLMDRFPIILILGAALLGKVGGEMIITDPGLDDWFRWGESRPIRWAFQAFTVAGVLLAAWRIRRRRPDAVEGSQGSSRSSEASPPSEPSET